MVSTLESVGVGLCLPCPRQILSREYAATNMLQPRRSWELSAMVPIASEVAV